MLRSMTGFGAAASEGRAWSLRTEVRSVNHRYLLVKTRVPGELSFLESDIEAAVKKKLARGAVTVHVDATRVAGADEAGLDVDAAARWKRRVRRLAKDVGVDGELSLDTLLALPGVVSGRNGRAPRAELERVGKSVLKLVRQSVDALVDMRTVEGGALAADLGRNAAAIGKLRGNVERRMPRVVRDHQSAVRERVETLLGGRQVEKADVAREVALLADKLDVSEEVSRLTSHLEQFDRTLALGGPVGRKLEFLVQEILREVNTVGSKCSDAKVAHWVVDLKTHVERLREQVQNVE